MGGHIGAGQPGEYTTEPSVCGGDAAYVKLL